MAPKAGFGLFLVALAMMAGLVGTDIRAMKDFSEALTPSFLGNIFVHFSVVVMAWAGGKMSPAFGEK